MGMSRWPDEGLVSARACLVFGWALFVPGLILLGTGTAALAGTLMIVGGAGFLWRAQVARAEAMPCRCGCPLSRHDRRRLPNSCRVPGCACEGWRAA